MKKGMAATAALTVLCASSAIAAPLSVPNLGADPAAGEAEVAGEGGVGGGPLDWANDADGGLLLVHHKKKHKYPHWYEGGEGGEGGEGRKGREGGEGGEGNEHGPVVIHHPVVHYVPIIPVIIGGPVRIVLEADLSFFAEFEPQIVAAPVGTIIPWSNPHTGHHGEVAVLSGGYDETVRLPCRTYRTTVVIDGRSETAIGTACQEPDGSWRIVN